jgi:hypothetical protein
MSKNIRPKGQPLEFGQTLPGDEQIGGVAEYLHRPDDLVFFVPHGYRAD